MKVTDTPQMTAEQMSLLSRLFYAEAEDAYRHGDKAEAERLRRIGAEWGNWANHKLYEDLGNQPLEDTE